MSKNILLIDHEDSFTMNIAGILTTQGAKVTVVTPPEGRRETDAGRYQGIILSPGPGRPEDAVDSLEVLRNGAGHIPILGICLGHQIMGFFYGGKIVRAARPVHGYASDVYHSDDTLFAGLPDPCRMMRYHSLVIQDSGFPEDLTITARTTSGEIMAIRHKRYNLAGVQFHPESVGSVKGERILQNWLDAL